MYHDWEIVAIKFDQDSSVLELSLVTVDHKHVAFRAFGCRYFRITDYIWQNVVYNFLVLSPNTEVDELLKKLKWLALEETRAEGDYSESVRVLLQSVVDGSLKLIHFFPSFGADVVLLCEEYGFE